MVGALLWRGMLIGVLAGLLLFSFARVFGEPQVDRAIAFETLQDQREQAMEIAQGHHPAAEPELVSRRMQASFGLLTGVMVYATAFGGLFALIFAIGNNRLGLLDPRSLSILIALLGFVSVALVPALKYPPNPPAIGRPDTIGARTILFATMLFMSVAAMVGAVAIRRHLVQRHDNWTACVIAAGFYVLAVIVVAILLPGVDEVPAAFPASVLWRFRLDSLALQLILWSTLGLGFGALTARDVERQMK